MRYVFVFALLVFGGVASAQPFNPCLYPVDKVTSVGVTATVCPVTQLDGRKSVMICNSPENAATPIVKVRVDRGTPVIGSGPGTVLPKGACVVFNISAGIPPVCISDAAATAVTTVECR